jgi:plasmid stabilization system protein ParE
MAAKVIITKKVYNQIDEIVDWYNERSLSAAKNFIEELHTFISKIARNPELYYVVIDGFRQCCLYIFPYYIIYKYYPSSHRVVIHKIIHNKRDINKRFA